MVAEQSSSANAPGAVAAGDNGPVPAVHARQLSKRIDDRAILRDINLRIENGQFVALLGANGAGKTTLLRILASLIFPSDGELLIFGQPLNRSTAALRARIGLVSHQSMLYRDLSARENLEFFAKLYGVKDPARRAMQLLEGLGLAGRANDPVRDFSRGMTQRVAIARAVIHGPQLILADEPFAGLDAPSIRAIEELLSSMAAAGKTVILVNHDIEQSLRLVQRVIVLRSGAIVMDQPAGGLTASKVLAEVVGPS